MGMLDEIERHETGRRKSHRAVAAVMRTGAMAAGAFGATLATRKLGGSDTGYAIGGYVPLSLAASAALHLAGVFNLGGDFNPLLHAMGDGALAAYASGVGAIAAHGGSIKEALLGTGEQTPEQKYADILRMTDKHRRAHR